jgi:hypothetical protein
MIFIYLFFLPFQLHQNPLKPIKSPSLTTDFILFLRKSIHGTTPFLDNYSVLQSEFWNHFIKKDLKLWFDEEASHGHICGDMKNGCQGWGDVKEISGKAYTEAANIILTRFKDQSFHQQEPVF